LSCSRKTSSSAPSVFLFRSQAQLERQLQEELEQRMQQPRLRVALLENAAAIAEVTAAQAARLG